LDCGDVFVEVLRKGPFRCSDEVTAFFKLEVGVFCVQRVLYGVNG
jgi:hypothetical protein